MRQQIWILGLLALAGCAHWFPDPPPPAAERIATSWRGAPLVMVEGHAFFSTFTPQRQDLSDGSQIYHYVNCIDWQDASTVTSGVSRIGTGAIASTTYEPGRKGNTCCDRQFLVKAGVVQEYRAVVRGDGVCSSELRHGNGLR